MSKATERSNLPAKLEETAVAPVESQPLANVWGVTQLSPQQRAIVVDALRESFPEWGAAEVLHYVDILGGNIYFNAEFWSDVVNRHEMTESVEVRQLKHDDDEWEEFLGDTKPEHVAAAAVCRIKRKDRAVPYVEVNYVRPKDPILYVGGKVDGTKLPDWPGQALKKARTTAIRRCACRSYALQDAKALYMAQKVEERVGESLRHGGLPPGHVVGSVPVRDPEDPYDLSTPPAPQVPSTKDVIDDAARRRLFAFASQYDFGNLAGGDTHKALKLIIAEQKGLEPDQASTRELTWDDWMNVIESIALNYALKQPIEGKVVHDAAQAALPLEGETA